MTLGNTQAGRPDGQCNREQTADDADSEESVGEVFHFSRSTLGTGGTGKGETVG